MFENWLLIHRHTLTHIDIGYLRGPSRLFNATLFPSLEFLRLSRWQMRSPVQFSTEDANVLGPRLKTFSWNFNIHDQHSEDWSAFGEPEANWVRDLAKCAAERKAVLAMVEIQFDPNSFWGTKEEMGYPWDRMDKVRDQTLKPNGMYLVYSEPPIDRDAWLKYVRTGKVDAGLFCEGADEASINHAAEDQHSNGPDEQENAGMDEPELQSAYHGEDIRGYFVRKPKTS